MGYDLIGLILSVSLLYMETRVCKCKIMILYIIDRMASVVCNLAAAYVKELIMHMRV